MKLTKDKHRGRIFVAFSIFCIAMTIMLFRVAWVQVVRGGEYSEKANAQQTSDIPIQPRRGSILDRNGKEMAATATCYTIWIRPGDLSKSKSSNKIKEISNELAVPLEMDGGEVLQKITSDKTLCVVKRYIEKGAADKIRDMKIPGIEIAEESRRFYPMGDFASTLLGSVNDEGVGRSGIEQEYNQYLSGIAGRWVKDTDINGNTLSYGQKKYHGAEDGLSVELTIDEVLQHYLDETLEKTMKDSKADKACGIVMNPKTGDILAMSNFPSFNPNNPYKPSGDRELEKFNGMEDEEKSKYVNQLWRNPIVSDVYEPGSTFKLITASSTLDEGLATPDTTFYCNGNYDVEGIKIHDWNRKAHGELTLTEAVGESCNPIHVQMAQKMGVKTFSEHIRLFGLKDKTGIDLPAEGDSLIMSEDQIGPVELATMGFGQGIAVTPIQLITAISSIGNDGVMMKPRVAKSLLDKNGKVVKKFPKKKVKQVMSENTADEMCKIMESEVKQFGGNTAYMPGYRIGGKTGTSEKSKEGKYTNRVCTSFVSMAPMEDPQIVVLIVVDNPEQPAYGATVAAPAAKAFYEKALPYLHITPSDRRVKEDDVETEYKYVPDVTGLSSSKAISKLVEQDIEYVIRPEIEEREDGKIPEFKVVDQYPKAGQKMNSKNKVYLYRE